jgi:hypothetical protein
MPPHTSEASYLGQVHSNTLVKAMGAFYNKPAAAACPYCKEELKADAIRCAHCTMPLPEDADLKTA